MLIKYVVFIGIILTFAAGCCEKIKTEAKDLRAKHQKCEIDDDCIIVDMYEAVGENNCLGPFQCSKPMNKNNISLFKKEAKELAEDFEHCSECTQASCAPLGQPFCNETTGLCDAEVEYNDEVI